MEILTAYYFSRIILIIIFILIYFTTFVMVYNKFVQIGRVVRVNYGPLEGKLATVVDILNDKRVLIDGENIQRQVIPIRRLQLTRQVIKVLRGAKTGKVRSIIAKEGVAQKFNESSLGKSFARQQRRQSLTDFERYKVLVLRRKLSKLLRAKVSKKKWFTYLNIITLLFYHSNIINNAINFELSIIITSKIWNNETKPDNTLR